MLSSLLLRRRRRMDGSWHWRHRAPLCAACPPRSHSSPDLSIWARRTESNSHSGRRTPLCAACPPKSRSSPWLRQGARRRRKATCARIQTKPCSCARLGVTWDLVAMSSQTHSGVHGQGMHWAGCETRWETHPVPASNFVAELNSGEPQPAHLKVPTRDSCTNAEERSCTHSAFTMTPAPDHAPGRWNLQHS